MCENTVSNLDFICIIISQSILCNKGAFFLSLKRLTEFPARILTRQPSDNAASLWGKRKLLGSQIQEKNAENNLAENQINKRSPSSKTCIYADMRRLQPPVGRPQRIQRCVHSRIDNKRSETWICQCHRVESDIKGNEKRVICSLF